MIWAFAGVLVVAIFFVRMHVSRISRLKNEIHRISEELGRRIASLEKEKENIRAIMAGMADGVLVVDANEKVLFVNPQAKRFLSSLSEQDIGRPLVEAVRLPDLLDLVTISRSSGEMRKRNVTLYTDEKEVVLEIQALPFLMPEQRGVMVLLHDITELNRMETMRQDFVANASHELRTPLTVMKGYVETLLDGADEDPKTRARFLRQISENVDRLSALTGDLLSLSRIASGASLPSSEPVLVRTALMETANRYRHLAEQKGLGLEVADVPEELTLLADPRALAEVLDNLVDNAIKYSKKGKIVLSGRKEGEGGTISVADNGIGMVRSELDRIFERFYRVDKAHSQQVGGTGLGLSIVKHLVEQMNGSIQVESELGVGTKFHVRLPSL